MAETVPMLLAMLPEMGATAGEAGAATGAGSAMSSMPLAVTGGAPFTAGMTGMGLPGAANVLAGGAPLTGALGGAGSALNPATIKALTTLSPAVAKSLLLP
jgi:hypothetical protein